MKLNNKKWTSNQKPKRSLYLYIEAKAIDIHHVCIIHLEIQVNFTKLIILIRTKNEKYKYIIFKLHGLCLQINLYLTQNINKKYRN